MAPMTKKVRNIPLHDSLILAVGNSPFDINKFYPKFRDIMQAEFPHRHSFYEFIFITEGEGIHYIDFEPHKIRPGSLYFVSPGQVHFWNIHVPLEGYLLAFTNDFLSFSADNPSPTDDISFFHKVRESPILRLTENQVARINTMIQTIYDEYHSEERDRVALLRAYLHILIIKTQRLYDAATSKGISAKDSSLVRRFMQLVSENIVREHSVQAYAISLGMSESHLRDMIKVSTGLSPGLIIRQHIVLEAKRLLASTDLTVAEIGYTMNFEDPSYFSRFLKRETGLSPGELRQQIRKKYLLSGE
jgi:AraC-like DNA-binding protein